MKDEYLTARKAADIVGIEREILQAYVSRGPRLKLPTRGDATSRSDLHGRAA